jgi:hypothetical protein
MGREQFLQTRAGNWSKIAMLAPPLVLGKRFFAAPKSARSSRLTPHKSSLGQHSKFCVRQFESITLCVRRMVNPAHSGSA